MDAIVGDIVADEVWDYVPTLIDLQHDRAKWFLADPRVLAERSLAMWARHFVTTFINLEHGVLTERLLTPRTGIQIRLAARKEFSSLFAVEVINKS